MKSKPFKEQDLLEGLNAESAHTDELVQPLKQELLPLERLQGTVKQYERPMDPVWDDYFDSDESVTDDFMESRDQPPRQTRN